MRKEGWIANTSSGRAFDGVKSLGLLRTFHFLFLSSLTAGPTAYARDGVQFTAPCLM